MREVEYTVPEYAIPSTQCALRTLTLGYTGTKWALHATLTAHTLLLLLKATRL